MGSPRTVLVVNPKSQSGALGRRWPELAATVRRELKSFEEVRTRAPGDATRLTREALRDGAERVVAIGGDGTINEVVNGFFEEGEPISETACLGVIPFGTGGDFRKSLHIPKDTTRAARIVAAGREKQIDIGALEYTTPSGSTEHRLFANIASFGISGLVDELVNTTTKRFGGRVSFLIATARASLRYKNQRVRMVFDDDSESAVDVTINTVAVANGRYFGGGMFIAPEAELDDGKFDIVMLGDFNVKDMVMTSRRLYAGTHLGMDKISMRHATKVHAEPLGGSDVRIDLDGETPGVLPATFSLMPRALRVVVP